MRSNKVRDYSELDTCESCGFEDAVTTVNDKAACYRCAKKARKNGRRPKERFTNIEEDVEDAYGQNRRVY